MHETDGMDRSSSLLEPEGSSGAEPDTGEAAATPEPGSGTPDGTANGASNGAAIGGPAGSSNGSVAGSVDGRVDRTAETVDEVDGARR